MGDISIIQALARAYMAKERARVGIPQQEQAAQAASTENMLRQAQAQHVLSQIPSPEEEAAKLDLTRAQTEMYRQHGQYYATPKTGAAGNWKPTVNTAGEINGFYNEKTLETRSLDDMLAGKGAAQAPPSVPAGSTGSIAGAAADWPVTREGPPTAPPPSGLPKGARTKAAPQPKTPSDGAGVQITTSDGKPAMYYPKTGRTAPLPDNAAFATDVRAERKAAATAVSPLTAVETLANQTEQALNAFDSTNGLMHPIDKAVANSTYKNTLQALAVPWGRLLGDSRISDQDRAAYQRSVGEPGFFLRELAPEVARQRLQNLREVLADIRAKYSDVLEGTKGMLGPVGGGANLLGTPSPRSGDNGIVGPPAPQSSGGFRIVGVRPKQ